MKPGSFTQIYIQLVFAVRKRENILSQQIRPRIYQYIGGIITDLGHKSIIINGVSDHIHIFFGLNPCRSISDTVHDIKRSSSLFINNNKLVSGKFFWQEGYGAFSYSRSQIDEVYKYIQNQESHHLKLQFREEYIELLQESEINYDPKFLFEFYDPELT